MRPFSGATLLSWSGGKDSLAALEALRARRVPIAGLLTTVTDGQVTTHEVPIDLVRAQAEALGLELVEVSLPAAPDNTTYNAVLGDALKAACQRGVEAVAYGDLRLADVRAYREAHLAALGLSAQFPVWGRPSGPLVIDLLSRGLRATLVCVDTTLAPADLVGRSLDRTLLAELPAAVDPAGEGGEFHTFVHDGPGFARPVEARAIRRADDSRFARVRLEACPSGS